jgi:glutaredoxin
LILLIGNENCPNCAVTKRLLDTKGVKYEYKLLSDLSDVDRNFYITLAKSKGNLDMPIIIKEGESINRSELLYSK